MKTFIFILALIAVTVPSLAYAQWGYNNQNGSLLNDSLNEERQDQRAYEQQIQQRREAEEAARNETQRQEYNDSVRSGGDLLYGNRSNDSLLKEKSNSYGGF